MRKTSGYTDGGTHQRFDQSEPILMVGGVQHCSTKREQRTTTTTTTTVDDDHDGRRRRKPKDNLRTYGNFPTAPEYLVFCETPCRTFHLKDSSILKCGNTGWHLPWWLFGGSSCALVVEGRDPLHWSQRAKSFP